MSKYTVYQDSDELFEADDADEIQDEITRRLENDDLDPDDVKDLEIRKNVDFTSEVEIQYTVSISLNDE